MLVILSTIGVLFLIALAVVVLVLVTTKKSNKQARPLTLEQKITLLNDRLAAGTITKEEYDRQKAELLKSI